MNRIWKMGGKAVILPVIMMALGLPGTQIQLRQPIQIYKQVDREINDHPATGITERVSVASDGTQGNANCGYRPAISADGRYVAFTSLANNLVPGDTNDSRDVFVHDRDTGQTTRVSVGINGAQGNDGSPEPNYPSISADGRYVAFESEASNLVSGDTNGVQDIFVHDRVTKITERVSLASDGTQGDRYSTHPSMSADGRFVGFTSPASNLVTGDTNGTLDVFIHDRNTGITELISVASDGTQGPDRSYDPSVSEDGRYVAFSSHCSNLVPEDTNGVRDIFVRDRVAGITERVSVASDGTQGNMDSVYKNISADGRYVAFASYANNLVPGDTNGHYDIFVHDRESGQTERISVTSDGIQANNWSSRPVISADGRYVAFQSNASNLVSGDTNGGYDQEGFDMFVHDGSTGETIRVSVASDGSEASHYSLWGTISADGHDVAFTSYARNLVSGDTNAKLDAFVHSRFEVLIFLPVIAR